MPGSLRSVGILLAGALLIGFSEGSWLLPVAAWVGPAFVLRYARDHSGWRGFLLVVAATTLATFIGFGGIWANRGPIMIASLTVGFGLLWSLPYLADRLLAHRLGGFVSTLMFPLAMTTVDFVNIRVNPLGSWGAVGFTQYGNLELMQLASVTGMIGITFLMGWFASVANWTWEHRAIGGVGLGPAVFAAVIAGVFAFGFWRLNLVPASDATIRVAGITAGHGPDLGKAVEEAPDHAAGLQAIEAHREAYFRETVREAEAGAQVVVWPEVAGAGYESSEAGFIARAAEIADEYDIYLAVPLFTFGDDGFRPDGSKLIKNKLLVFDPNGTIVIEHVKYGGRISEGYREQGDGILRTVTTPFGVLGGLICYDMDYPAIVEQAGLNGTGVMLDPSSDWQDIDPTHTYMAVFPAIENGMSVVRQTDGGLSIAVDPYGRVLAQTDFFDSTDRTMVAQVPTEHVATLYTAFGRWLGWMVVAGFVLVVVRALMRRPAA
jgi:apolipoprotein N-acyltransferase